MKKDTKTPIFDTSLARTKIESGRRAGWWRRKGSKPKNFKYLTADGAPVTDEKQLERIKSLVVPPAWKFVRVNPAKSGRVQAVGMDASGRVQYIYNPQFAARRQRKKFAKIERFGEYLPNLRRITNEHIALAGFPREKVLAVMMRLINSLYIRVGTEKSVRHYKTYGITTLRNRHLEIGPRGELVFSFVGKHHIKHRRVLVDAELAAVMKDLKALGGARRLFHYVDADNRPHPIRPQDVNEYLKSITAPEFSAKDFRTWGGTLLAAVELAEIGRAEDEKTTKKNILKAVRKVAERLGNTPSVCRGSYIHPAVIKAYENGLTLEAFTPRKGRRLKRFYDEHEPEEIALLKLFKNGAD
ncbi:MAG: DNA topoisomerase IB [Acidobacteria bacterium]|nr:DNA topoisomerase IB [Acidobacteriota bacterium]